MHIPDYAAQLRENVRRVRQTIAGACEHTGRSSQTVALVAVTKYVEPDLIRVLLSAGVSEIGESRPQQLAARAGELGTLIDEWRDPIELSTAGEPPTVPRWHMVGHLQRNKVKLVLEQARILHSLDSTRLVEEVGKVAERLEIEVDGFAEVNVAGEASKHGVRPADLPALLESISAAPHIRLRGLMTMAPWAEDPEAARPHFARLRELLEAVRQRGLVGPDCAHLSMGMSNDYAVAVQEGATFIRVGSALFEGLDFEDQ